MADSSTIAVIFDFDDTLAPDSTTKLLRSHGMDADKFWKKDVKTLVQNGYDPALAWLRLLLENVGDDLPLGKLTNPELKEFGASLDADFFDGLPEFFDDLRAIANEAKVLIDFYVISGGLREVILGSQIVNQYFEAVYGSELDEGDKGYLSYVKRCVTFTEKTRYIFEINKGIPQEDALKNPFLVNMAIPEEMRPIPMENMIYVGDGLTDIPCFSLIGSNGGIGFGVFDPSDQAKAKRAFLEFLKPKRIVTMNSPRYGEDDDLGSLLRAAVGNLASQIQVRRRRAY
ncbi:MAG: HAD family hydrolase [Actinomycetota bacterium]